MRNRSVLRFVSLIELIWLCLWSRLDLAASAKLTLLLLKRRHPSKYGTCLCLLLFVCLSPLPPSAFLSTNSPPPWWILMFVCFRDFPLPLSVCLSLFCCLFFFFSFSQKTPIVPVTIKQILDAMQGPDTGVAALTIDGQDVHTVRVGRCRSAKSIISIVEVVEMIRLCWCVILTNQIYGCVVGCFVGSQLSFVCTILSVDEQASTTTYNVDDGSGQLELKMWAVSSSETSQLEQAHRQQFRCVMLWGTTPVPVGLAWLLLFISVVFLPLLVPACSFGLHTCVECISMRCVCVCVSVRVCACMYMYVCEGVFPERTRMSGYTAMSDRTKARSPSWPMQ